MYRVRSVIMPSGFSTRVLNTNNYSDSDIDYLYQVFGCCAADLTSKFSAAMQKGDMGQMDDICQKMKIMSIGMSLLSDWYNPNAGQVDVPIEPILGGIYWANVIIDVVASNGSLIPVTTLCNASFLGVVSNQDMFNALFASLNVSSKFTMTFKNPNPMTFQSPNGYTGAQWIYIQFTNNAGEHFRFWYKLVPFTPCVSVENMQSIVEKMLSICGCVDCKNIAQLTDDNLYKSVGQQYSYPAPESIGFTQVPNLLKQI